MVRRRLEPPFELWVTTRVKVAQRRPFDPVEASLWAAAALFGLLSLYWALTSAG